MRQLLESPEPYRIIFGARNTGAAQAAYDALSYDRSQNSVTVLPLELNNTRQIKPFVSDVLSKLGGEKLDYVFLCAGITNDAKSPGPYGSQWSEALIVNHLCK